VLSNIISTIFVAAAAHFDISMVSGVSVQRRRWYEKAAGLIVKETPA
jgi:hypothetical protein